MLRKFFVAIPITVLCHRRLDRVRDEEVRAHRVGEVNEKVDSQGRAIEETQERTRQNEGRISEVDQKAAAADQTGGSGGPGGSRPRTRRPTRSAAEANAKFDTIDRASKRLVYEVVLSEDQGNFKFGKTMLPDEAKQKIDEMVAQIKQDPKNIYLEIEGHTDNVGAAEDQRADRSRARRGGEEVSLRAVPDSAAQDERHQLRRGQAGRAEQDEGWAARRTAASSSRCSRKQLPRPRGTAAVSRRSSVLSRLPHRLKTCDL